MADNKDTSDTSPAELMSGLNDSGLTKPLMMSAVFHLVLIALFSLGYIGLCMKYGTRKPKAASEAEKEQQAQADLEKKRKEKADKAAKEDAAPTTTSKTTETKTEEKKVPSVIKNTQEVIKDKPTQPSSLDSFDGDL